MERHTAARWSPKRRRRDRNEEADDYAEESKAGDAAETGRKRGGESFTTVNESD